MRRNLRIHLLIAGIALSLNLAPAAWGQDDEAYILAPLLFPSSATWLDVSKLPKIPEERLAELAPQLKSAFKAESAQTRFEAEYCPVSEKIFEEWYRRGFYLVDANGDGLDDILYSGSFPCGEADFNVIWYSDAYGNYYIKNEDLELSSVLRLLPKPGGPLKVTYAPGCCGNFVYSYYQDTPGEPAKNRAQTFYNPLYGIDLNQPQLNKNIVFNKEWVELRREPKIDDVYDQGGGGLGYVYMGNILTIISGFDKKNICRGTLVAYDQSQDWALVVLDASCEKNQQFSVSPGNFIRVGWVETQNFELEH